MVEEKRLVQHNLVVVTNVLILSDTDICKIAFFSLSVTVRWMVPEIDNFTSQGPFRLLMEVGIDYLPPVLEHLGPPLLSSGFDTLLIVKVFGHLRILERTGGSFGFEFQCSFCLLLWPMFERTMLHTAIFTKKYM